MTQLEFNDKFQTDEQMFVWVNEAEKKIAELEAENAKLKDPKTCETCIYFVDGVCEHIEVPEFDVPAYINLSGCGLHEPKAP